MFDGGFDGCVSYFVGGCGCAYGCGYVGGVCGVGYCGRSVGGLGGCVGDSCSDGSCVLGDYGGGYVCFAIALVASNLILKLVFY